MISIVVDTNLLKSGSTDFTDVQFVNKITSLIDKLESNDLYDVVQILIPQIVIDELYEHQVKAHTEKFSAIKSCKFPNFEVVPCDNYCDILRDKFDIAIKELSLRDAKSIVLPYPENEVLPGIIKRALSKQPPFEGRDRESDKGFKDVIIWETVVAHRKATPGNIMVLCSRDGRLCDRHLGREFHDLFNEDIHLLKLDADSYQPLYDKLGDLTKHRLTPTLEERLKQNALDLLDDELLRPFYVDEYFECEAGEQRCDDIYLSDKRINSVNSTFGDDTIYIEAEVDVGIRSSVTGYDDIEPFRFNIEYSLEDEQYRLVGYDSFSGYIDIREREFVLE